VSKLPLCARASVRSVTESARPWLNCRPL